MSSRSPILHSRRAILRAAAAGASILVGLRDSAAATDSPLAADPRARITGFAACSWTLRDSSPRVFSVAKNVGLDGVELDMGSPPDFHIDSAEKRTTYKGAAEKSGLRVASVALGCLNRYPLKSDGRAPEWVEKAIGAAADFGVKVVLLAFFGDGELKTPAERERVADILRELGPVAEKNKVFLGLETTLSARETLSILERSKSSAVRVYYDTGNSRHWGHDAPREIRALGQKICAFHFKDGTRSHGDSRLGEGKVDFPAVARAMHDIAYRGWVTLESHAPDLIPDLRHSLSFAREVLAGQEKARRQR